jgi:hypothetical protein
MSLWMPCAALAQDTEAEGPAAPGEETTAPAVTEAAEAAPQPTPEPTPSPAPDVPDEIAEAIQVIKDASDPEKSAQRAFRSDFRRAQRTLTQAPSESIRPLIALLDEAEFQTHLNAAILLAEIAAEQERASPEVIAALQRCVDNRNEGVRLWGVVGLIRSQASNQVKNDAIRAGLDTEQPVILRLAILSFIDDANYEGALPVLQQHMLAIEGTFQETVDKQLLTGQRVMDAEGNVIEERIDLTRLSLGNTKVLADRIARIPEAEEMILTGYLFESLLERKQDERLEPSFEDNPPWDLQKCIDAAQEVILE